MNIKTLTTDHAAQTAADALDVGRCGFPLASAEGVAASARRAASFLCPATQRQLADAVLEAVTPVLAAGVVTRNDVNSVIEALVLNGDLVEAFAEEGRRLLFLGPPTFVERTPDSCLVIGVRPFGERLIRSDESLSLEYRRHTRLCRSEGALAKAALRAEGLREIAADKWVASPDTKDAKAVLAKATERWRTVGEDGIPGLQIIDRKGRVTFYKGRWREVTLSDTGLFIGRRPQEFGTPLWCVVNIKLGQPVALVDLPVADVAQPGCDEAWRLQAALDSLDQHPQIFRVRPVDGDARSFILDCFSPVPSWADKYLALKGESVDKPARVLFSYLLPESAISDVSNLLVKKLWMKQVEGEVD